jgi:23S rRNA (cytosine1962-C5)-methyltransferase
MNYPSANHQFNLIPNFGQYFQKMKEITVKSDKVKSIQRKHPWVFSGALLTDVTSFQDGEPVSLKDQKNNFLGIGHFQHGTIAVRMLTGEKIKIDKHFFKKKFDSALALRKQIGLFSESNNICRLVHGEGDGLPGLIIDHYNKALVIQCHSVGMYLALDEIAFALRDLFGSEVRSIYSKNTGTLPSHIVFENKYLFGKCDMPHISMENGISYAIDWVNGQKTGFFIDQRENRALLGKYAKGNKVLNTFCYSGGFSLSALKAGALEVHSLDSSEKAIQLTEENLNLNKFKGKHRSIVDNAVKYLNNLETQYDLIVLDPPAFAKHRNKRHQAVQAYKRLNANAIRQIKPGGIIFTFSCSQVVDKTLFNHTVISAAMDSGREVKILEQIHQPADHPISAFHPEGEYLKGLVIQVI